jgi:hypothetical protein
MVLRKMKKENGLVKVKKSRLKSYTALQYLVSFIFAYSNRGRADYPHLLVLAPQCFSSSGIPAF